MCQYGSVRWGGRQGPFGSYMWWGDDGDLPLASKRVIYSVNWFGRAKTAFGTIFMTTTSIYMTRVRGSRPSLASR
jgi:drug/metabolite transporter superfamily protein YnfA